VGAAGHRQRAQPDEEDGEDRAGQTLGDREPRSRHADQGAHLPGEVAGDARDQERALGGRPHGLPGALRGVSRGDGESKGLVDEKEGQRRPAQPGSLRAGPEDRAEDQMAKVQRGGDQHERQRRGSRAQQGQERELQRAGVDKSEDASARGTPRMARAAAP